MPTRPEWRDFYKGEKWQKIRARILSRAGNRCERCGVPNHKTVLRVFGWWTEATTPASVWSTGATYTDRVTSSFTIENAIVENAEGRQFIRLPWKCTRDGNPPPACFPAGNQRWVWIVLTIAHLNHNPRDNRPANLQALCQYCHLKNDARFHYATRRRRAAAASGQAWLIPAIEKGIFPK